MQPLELTFSIPGDPKGKGRPRFSMRGGYVHTYTPKETADYEEYIRECYLLQVGEKRFEGALSVEIEGRFRIPSSLPKKTQEAMERGEIAHTKKIDCDNLAKVVLDALNGVAYDDDKQVAELTVRKMYSRQPGIRVTMRGQNDGSKQRFGKAVSRG